MGAKNPKDVVEQAVKAISAGDADGALEMYEATALFVGPNSEISCGTEEIRQALESFMNLKPNFRVDIDQVLTGEGCDVAQVSGRWSFVGTDPEGQEVQMSGRNVDVVRRQADGTWRLVIDNPFHSS